MSTASQAQQRADALPDDELRRLYRMMLLIRRFEERTEEQYTRARIGGYCHLNIGEEATVAGVVGAMAADDYLFASYRDHGVAIAVGSTPDGVMAELMGKETGVAHGRGGSMHLLDVKHHFLGGWGIVGGQLPVALGAALALEYEERPGAVVCMLGDAAVNIGAFHESLNIAGVWHLPLVTIITNNQYGMGTSVEMASAEPELYKRASAYRMPSERVDGQDVLAVREAAKRALHLARDERQPCVIECMTYRYRGHSVADAAHAKLYRTQAEIDEWMARDPLTIFGDRLRKRGLLNDKSAKEMAEEIEREVQAAIDFAVSSPDPDPQALYVHMYNQAAQAQFARMVPGAPFNERHIAPEQAPPQAHAGESEQPQEGVASTN
ncbi:MAG TPA: pyruvate dehydrogenase (acetyl-transferring) E1 component subunit alpha [Chloroflexota bacterium]|nr:pyruvate dehydrogenase (acetyl-transferring) E1 component subunit alpha [Chloroflexota bacterium]